PLGSERRPHCSSQLAVCGRRRGGCRRSAPAGCLRGGRPLWRPASQRQRESSLLGATAARRAARSRARAALKAALAPLVPARAAPGLVGRGRAARPAWQFAVDGGRVPGSERRRRNAARHAPRVPPGGIARACAEGIAWEAAGPRPGLGGGGFCAEEPPSQPQVGPAA
ncbi:unnamed protein product, partial [Prorocentrum cordatum]